MVHDILCVTTLFITRVVLPVALTVAFGEWIARRFGESESGEL
jgi:hypothetical protein